jgi:hypothetical protein
MSGSVHYKKVFTPRKMAVNEDMYVERAEQESVLLEAINSPFSIFLTGETGIGKTWSTRRILTKNAIPHTYVNAANLATHDQLREAMLKSLRKSHEPKKVSATETVSTTVEPSVAGTKLGNIVTEKATTTEFPKPDHLALFLEEIESRHKHAPRFVLVLDNVEFQLTEAFIGEIARVIVGTEAFSETCQLKVLVIVASDDGDDALGGILGKSPSAGSRVVQIRPFRRFTFNQT